MIGAVNQEKEKLRNFLLTSYMPKSLLVLHGYINAKKHFVAFKIIAQFLKKL